MFKGFFSFELTLTPGSNSFFIFNTHLLLLPIRSIMQVCRAVGRSENLGGEEVSSNVDDKSAPLIEIGLTPKSGGGGDRPPCPPNSEGPDLECLKALAHSSKYVSNGVIPIV